MWATDGLWWYDYSRYRKKFRCPLKHAKINFCPFASTGANSPYGRIIYVKDKENEPRSQGPVLYKSEKWKELYKGWTSTERVNDVVLNTYSLHKMHVHNGAKNGFFAIIAGIYMHLDARIKFEE